MEHLEWHQHAFLDENNVVINILVFDESAHGSQLLEDVRELCKATTVVCCCDHGIAYMGGIWTGTEFRPIQPTPESTWNSELKAWETPIEGI